MVVPQRQQIAGNGAVVEVGEGWNVRCVNVRCVACGRCGFGCAMPQRQRIAGNAAVVEVGDGWNVRCVACERCGFGCAVPQRQQIAGNAAVVGRGDGRNVLYAACGRCGFGCAMPQRQRIRGNAAVVGRKAWASGTASCGPWKEPVVQDCSVYRPMMRACWGPTVRTGPERVPRPSTEMRPSRQ